MYGGIDVLFHAVISILSFSLKIAQLGFYVTFITGEALFNLFAFFVTKGVNFIHVLLSCSQILYEDFYYFVNDLKLSVSTLFNVFEFIGEYFQFIYVSVNYILLNVSVNILNCLKVTCLSLYSLFSQFLKCFILFKDSLLLIGSSIWFTFTYAIPVGFLNIVYFFCKLWAQSILKLYSLINNSLLYLKHTFLENKFPYESVLGLVMGILLLYIIVRNYAYILKFVVHFILTVINPLVSLVTNSSMRIWNMCFRNRSAQHRHLFQDYFFNNFIASRFRNDVNTRPSVKNKSTRNDRNLIKDSGEIEDLCIICLDEKRDIILLPCRHFCMCLNCSNRFSYDNENCPICRQAITELLQVYY